MRPSRIAPAGIVFALVLALGLGACSSVPPPLDEQAIPAPPVSGSPVGSPSIYPVPSPRSHSPKPPPVAPPVAPISPYPTTVPSSAVSPSPTATVVVAPGGIRCGDTSTQNIRGATVVTNTTCFEVSGSNMSQLQASIDANGPKVNDYRRAGATRWKVGWSYDFSPGARCSITDPRVKVTVTYLLPRWTDPKSAKAATRSQWNAFMAEVKTHESGHRDIAIQAGVAAIAALESTPSAAECGVVQTRADARVRAVMDKYRAKQQAYDAQASVGG